MWIAKFEGLGTDIIIYCTLKNDMLGVQLGMESWSLCAHGPETIS